MNWPQQAFVAILLLYLHVEYPKASESNIRYRQWVTWILISEIMDIITGRMIDYGQMIPPVLNILVNTAYFYTTAGSFWGFARYLNSFVKTKKSRIYMAFNTAAIIVYICIMTLNVFTGWVLTFDGNGQYIHGPAYFLCRLGAKASSPCLHEREALATAHHRRPSGPEMWAKPESSRGSSYPYSILTGSR